MHIIDKALLSEYVNYVVFRIKAHDFNSILLLVFIIGCFLIKLWPVSLCLILLDFILEYPARYLIDEDLPDSYEFDFISAENNPNQFIHAFICLNGKRLVQTDKFNFSGYALIRINNISDKNKKEKLFKKYCKIYNMKPV